MNLILENNTTSLVPILLAVVLISVPVIVLAVIVFVKLIVKNAKKQKTHKKYQNFDYQSYFGGEDNIENVEVVMSRVNVTVKELDLVKLEELKALGMGILVVGNVVKCANQEFADKVESAISQGK